MTEKVKNVLFWIWIAAKPKYIQLDMQKLLLQVSPEAVRPMQPSLLDEDSNSFFSGGTKDNIQFWA